LLGPMLQVVEERNVPLVDKINVSQGLEKDGKMKRRRDKVNKLSEREGAP
jgi:hypothetical protein